MTGRPIAEHHSLRKQSLGHLPDSGLERGLQYDGSRVKIRMISKARKNASLVLLAIATLILTAKVAEAQPKPSPPKGLRPPERFTLHTHPNPGPR